jgi:hypothetical protein
VVNKFGLTQAVVDTASESTELPSEVVSAAPLTDIYLDLMS